MGKQIIEVEYGNEAEFFQESEDDGVEGISEEHDPIIKGVTFKNEDRVFEIQQKIEEIRTDFKKRMKVKKIPWHEHMSIVSDEKIQFQNQDINDDIQREVQFYNITLNNVKLALSYLQTEGISLERPDDYMAEMYKTDKQMNRVKGKLVSDKEKIKHKEEQELRLQSKKLQKKIQAKREVEKQRMKNKNLAAISQWKQEIHAKGDNAKDLSQFLLQKQDFSKDKNQQFDNRNQQNQGQSGQRGPQRGSFNNKGGSGGKFGQNSRGGGSGGKFGQNSRQEGGGPKFNKNIKKGPQKGGMKKGNKKGIVKRVGKIQRRKQASKGAKKWKKR